MKFFAGANTRFGFMSIFGEVLEGIERVYILKGSSGCGKSTLMRKIAKQGEELGLHVDYILCSADPKSLDGIIIPKISVAIIDGTSPHIMDVKYPCVRESIINLGQFWKEKLLLPQREKVIYLTDLKGCHYKNAYRALAAAGNIRELEKELISQCMENGKKDKIAFKLCHKLFSKKGRSKKIFSSSFSAEGYAQIDSFDDVHTVYSVNGAGAGALINAIHQIAFESGEEIIAAMNVFDPSRIDAIYFPEKRAIVTQNKSGITGKPKEYHSVSASGYLSKSKASQIKNRLNALEKLEHELLSEAQRELQEAKTVHDEIESIYIPAMDFHAMDEYTISLAKQIFGE